MHGAPWLPIVYDLPARLPVLAVPVHRDRYLRGPRRRPDCSHIRRGQAERRVDTLQSPGMQRGPAALALGRLVLAILPIGAIMCRGRSQSRSERSESHATRRLKAGALLTVILVGSRLERREDGRSPRGRGSAGVTAASR